MRTIKRYGNRKLYDTSLRRYINLIEVAELVEKGTEVKVLDSKTGEDITKLTLSQILHDREKKKEGFVSKTLFTDLIRKSSSSIVEAFKRSVRTGAEAIAWVEDEIDGGLKRLVKAGDITEKQGKKLRQDLVNRIVKGKSRFQHRIDDAVMNVLHRLNIPAQKDMRRLADQLDKLTARVEALAAKKPAAPAPKSGAGSEDGGRVKRKPTLKVATSKMELAPTAPVHPPAEVVPVKEEKASKPV
ncbi:MAG: phasin family protein [Candidatus Riflebacteria bacterium]|nr:phasin family protein [Candidatus Riflebacteria bacterium]